MTWVICQKASSMDSSMDNVIYYRKIGSNHIHGKSIALLYEDRSPTHQYTEVSDWKSAKKMLKKRHNTNKVHESSDMFKVWLLPEPTVKDVTPGDGLPRYRHFHCGRCDHKFYSKRETSPLCPMCGDFKSVK